MQAIKVPVLRNPDIELPTYATKRSAGVDVRALIDEDMVNLRPGERLLIETGIKVAIPEGFEIQVRPRSGASFKQGLTVLNSPGTIDSDYRGDIGVILINLGQEPVAIKRDERIGQFVLAPVVQIEWEVVDSLDETERGEGGFGHTGKE